MENGGKAWTEQLDDPVTSSVEGPFWVLFTMCPRKWGWSGKWNENENTISLAIVLNAEPQHHSHGSQ